MVMSPDFTAQSAAFGLAGGVLIGLAASLMLLGLGRIAGVSGIAARAAGIADNGPPKAVAWAFLVGLPLGAAALMLAGLVQPAAMPSAGVVAIAGFLVGIGTRLGNGCTSGHGVCGTSRLSTRSIVATVTFIAAGIATVAALRALGVMS